MISNLLYRSRRVITRAWVPILTILVLSALVLPAIAQTSEPVQAPAAHEGGGEASLVLPNLSQVNWTWRLRSRTSFRSDHLQTIEELAGS
jgi:hypothetical protein